MGIEQRGKIKGQSAMPKYNAKVQCQRAAGKEQKWANSPADMILDIILDKMKLNNGVDRCVQNAASKPIDI
jgi:hypothetical protein